MADGDDLYERGYYAQALRQYQLARRDDPTLPGIDGKLRNAQIRTYIAQGDQCAQRRQWDDARRAYEEVQRIDSNNAEIGERLVELRNSRANYHFALGTQLLSEGNPFDAIPELEQALALWPEHPRAAATIERALRQKKEQESRAETAYQEGLRARNDGRLEEAIRNFTSAVRLNPHHVAAELELTQTGAAMVDALVAQGDDAMSARRFADALSAYREAQQRDPQRRELAARIDRAELEAHAEDLAAEGDRALARQNWQVAFDRFDAASRASSERERFRDRLERARDSFAASLLAAARDHEAAGRYEEALAALRQICEFHPGYSDAHERYAELRDGLSAAEQLYVGGLDAHEACDLLTAQSRFEECVRALPGYRDAAERLAEIDSSIQLAQRLYDRAVAAERISEARRARLLYQECLAVVRPFRDASDRLRRLRRPVARQTDLQKYDEACQLQAARDLQKARELLLACRRERPDYRDTGQRLADVEAGLANAQRAYLDGNRAEEVCQLEKAKRLYGQCVAICSPYEDVELRLRRIDTALGSLRDARRLDRERRLLAARERYLEVLKVYPAAGDARQRASEIDRVCTDLDARYRRMRAAERAGKFRLALLAAVEIQKRCVEYEDVDASVARLECEADYADGRSFEELGRPDVALRCYVRCEKRDPHFRDVRGRVADCRRRLGMPARPGK